jgi:hypothetical protein
LTWGLNKDSLLEVERASANLPTFKEIISRLAKLYPDYIICKQPHNCHFVPPKYVINEGDVCGQFVANAAMPHEDFRWHVDADPSEFPEDCAWVKQHGQYVNTNPGVFKIMFEQND